MEIVMAKQEHKQEQSASKERVELEKQELRRNRQEQILSAMGCDHSKSIVAAGTDPFNKHNIMH